MKSRQTQEKFAILDSDSESEHYSQSSGDEDSAEGTAAGLNPDAVDEKDLLSKWYEFDDERDSDKKSLIERRYKTMLAEMKATSNAMLQSSYPLGYIGIIDQSIANLEKSHPDLEKLNQIPLDHYKEARKHLSKRLAYLRGRERGDRHDEKGLLVSLEDEFKKYEKMVQKFTEDGAQEEIQFNRGLREVLEQRVVQKLDHLKAGIKSMDRHELNKAKGFIERELSLLGERTSSYRDTVSELLLEVTKKLTNPLIPGFDLKPKQKGGALEQSSQEFSEIARQQKEIKQMYAKENPNEKEEPSNEAVSKDDFHSSSEDEVSDADAEEEEAEHGNGDPDPEEGDDAEEDDEYQEDGDANEESKFESADEGGDDDKGGGDEEESGEEDEENEEDEEESEEESEDEEGQPLEEDTLFRVIVNCIVKAQ